MLSGMREAGRALQLLRGKGDDSEAGLVSSRTATLSRADKRKRQEEEGENALQPTPHLLLQAGFALGVELSVLCVVVLIACSNTLYHCLQLCGYGVGAASRHWQ
jgi:hypothetical protein